MNPAPILRTSLVIFHAVLVAMVGVRAAELAVPENVVFERDIEFANPDNQHMQWNLARLIAIFQNFPFDENLTD